MKRLLLGVIAACGGIWLSGCAHHPVDCALGIGWADCKEGTAGYNNGGGGATRAEKAREAQAALNSQIQAIGAAVRKADDDCATSMETPELDAIRHKVELHRAAADVSPAFEVAANNTFPSEEERPVIAKWATIRDACVRRTREALTPPPTANASQATFLQQDWAFSIEASARVSELIVALYQDKLTYGEFAQKRYEIGRDALVAERQFREARLLQAQAQLAQDQERNLQAQQLAQQNFQNRLLAWSTYMQTVNARQPLTVGLHGTCTSQRIGNTVTTNCN